MSAVAAGGDGADAKSRLLYLIALVVLALVAALASWIVYRAFFPLDSGDLDEGVYVFQASMLLHGLVSLPVHTYGEFFRPWLTGESDGRIFTEYQFGLPAFLAVAELLFGSVRVGLALVAGGTVFATYGFAYELLRDRRVAITASAFFVCSPIFLVQSALILTYVLSLFGLTAAGWGLLRGCRTERRRDLFVGALALGLVVLTRPFDALLFGVPLLALVLYRLHRERSWGSAAAFLAVPLLAGLAPFVAVTLWYNWQATGSPLAFPNMTADPLNTFGFGTRRLMVGQPKRAYSVHDAFVALGENGQTIPSWLFGGGAMLVLAGVGLYKLRRSIEAVLLVVVAVAFPIGYFFWWATVLSGATAKNGLGPEYYLPSFVPLVILGAVGLTGLIERRGRLLALASAAVLVGVTGYAVPPKVSGYRYMTAVFRQVSRLVPPHLADALVFVDVNDRYMNYLVGKYPFLETDPDLGGAVVYATDQGARDASLMREMPSRKAYVLRSQYEPGNKLFSPTGGLIRVRAEASGRFTVSVKALEVPGGSYARAYISNGVTTRYQSLRRGPGGTYVPVRWSVAVGSAAQVGAGGTSGPVLLLRSPARELTVGVESSANASFSRPTMRESRIDYATSGGTITVVNPGLGWAYIEYPKGGLWLPTDVTSEVEVRLTPG